MLGWRVLVLGRLGEDSVAGDVVGDVALIVEVVVVGVAVEIVGV